ncbi:patatin-like phospholipase family protein [Clostridium rectalis]|uniref:patatin-like phospholipase family protein n=1 Tax=Clostridium rectalis TaxID=2040295 RepID=UPI000F63D39A|nr:patatin family protein [Clostridium rectalis]
MENIGLVLEGGGMRGLYTAGILDFFMEKNIYFPYVIGVSMGACNATSYLSRQIGRNKVITVNYINNPKYLSYKNLFKYKSILGLDFIYNEIPNSLEPFDFQTFFNSNEELKIVATDCNTGKPVYFSHKNSEDILTIVRASSSLPFISPIVNYKGMCLLDGGISDSIPIKKSIKDGNNKNVIILTRHKGYRKEPFKNKRLLKAVYYKYAGLINAMENRYKMYNDTLDYIDKLEKEGKVLVIRPEIHIKVSRIEKNTDKLENLYNMGYLQGKTYYKKVKEWIK